MPIYVDFLDGGPARYQAGVGGTPTRKPRPEFGRSVEELYRRVFETMRKELVQHDERLEKEKEDIRRRDADLCSQRLEELLQNLVKTSFTKALTDLGHVTDTQDEAAEIDGEIITQASANSLRRNGQSPGEGKGTIPKGKEGRKIHGKEKRSQGERQRARARARTGASERRGRNKAKRAKARTRARTRAKGREQTKQARLRGTSLRQEEREKATAAKEKDHEWSKSAVASLVQGATETDRCLLLDEGSWRTGVYTYEHEAKRCITCESLP